MSKVHRESLRTKDNKNYTLWLDIEDVMNTLLPIYWTDNKEKRKERGWIYRGQSNAEWDFTPSLYRPPCNEDILYQRKKYTDRFLNDFCKNYRHIGIQDLSEDKLHAIAQHYGFYTLLLDFSWNIETAAYFATSTKHNFEMGCIYGFNVKEYNEMRNPFSSLGLSLEMTENIFTEHGLDSLPSLELVEFPDIPRINKQEGVFVKCPINKSKVLMHECIDRYYFNQRAHLTYFGKYEYRTWALPSHNMFNNKNTYDLFISRIKETNPELFNKTPNFDENDLFPPNDDISYFVQNWKTQNPDPTIKKDSAKLHNSIISKIETTRFSKNVEDYYFSRNRQTPYQSQFIIAGRKLIQAISKENSLDDTNNQKWLLWKLINEILEGNKYTCTIKLGREADNQNASGLFYLNIIDRWLAATYRIKITEKQINEGFWQYKFDNISYVEFDKQKMTCLDRIPNYEEEVKTQGYNSNPEILSVYQEIKTKLYDFNTGEKGSFLYDLQCIMMKEFGRSLEVVIGIANLKGCYQCSPLVRPEHSDIDESFVAVIYDGFFQKMKYTCLCSKHWDYLSEGDMNFLDNKKEIRLGLA